MSTKKLKKMGIAFRKTGSPVLVTLSNYIGYVVNWLELADEDRQEVTALEQALANIDLSSVSNAWQVLSQSEAPKEVSTEPAAGESDKKPKGKKKKNKEEASEAPTTSIPAIAQEVDSVSEEVEEATAEDVDTQEKRKKKSRKKNAK